MHKTSWIEMLTKIITSIFYIADIMVNFRTSFVDDFGKEIISLDDISNNYIKSTLILDVIAIFPWELVF
jgi:hypothetical protein